MLQVLSLGLADGPGVSWSEWITRNIALSLDVMGDGVDKGLLIVLELNDDGLAWLETRVVSSPLTMRKTL